ncbi:MAG: porin [Dechloromonas sp.]|uniref:Porin n=1 Tax=Candidatus Dechloromonas phosphorivorans TaxID=2899244 RepID=A0A935MQ05_9RHOO|nr:porin [Candidatus Dechloromonas phosphorivorans]
MQKKIIALAIAGLASTAAFAQSNVTVYGVVDAAYIYTHTNGGDRLNNKANEKHGNDFNGIQSGQLTGSRIGFKGTEDLGNGLEGCVRSGIRHRTRQQQWYRQQRLRPECSPTVRPACPARLAPCPWVVSTLLATTPLHWTR